MPILTDLRPVDPADAATIAAVVALQERVRLVDVPFARPGTAREHAAWLRHGWDDVPPREFVLPGTGGTPLAVGALQLSERDNRHYAWVDIAVDPAQRRQGAGTALWRQLAGLAREAGRTTIGTEGPDGVAGRGFAASLGLAAASREAQRRLDVAALDRHRLRALRDEAAPAAAGYTLLRIAGSCPAGLLEPIARLTAAINDAPTDDLAIEDQVWTGDRIRAFETCCDAAGRRVYRVVAVRDADGALAGHTVASAIAELPAYVDQLDTAVAREHRGHRLGLLLKADMLDWLAATEPQARWMDTWNAVSNPHMIRVNEALGYRLVGEFVAYQGPLDR